ncbi:hypothetical protein QT711_15150 [Sporosarcina saromensis]|uniref:Aminoglycoside-2''-adenylyltransferase n=1 Tax=Sporosarcina saromensis TaxID=359365 RepID=A0ABU4GC40_9BACL|nr:hypothetical protein [Sporosarcina saromensis]MDW0114534.1 hypothetical protein [Sporosarcina saromensis]
MLSPFEKVANWMEAYDRPWGIAGGWAIDLFVGQVTREHSDIEIAILREDQHGLKRLLHDWSFKKVVKHQFVDWGPETLELPIHELHGTHQGYGDQLELLLNEVINDQWIFRRDPRISFPSSLLFLKSPQEIPFLHPVIVLLYKANNTREKDHADFLAVKDLIGKEDQEWLCDALKVHVPGHLWISELQGELV